MTDALENYYLQLYTYSGAIFVLLTTHCALLTVNWDILL